MAMQPKYKDAQMVTPALAPPQKLLPGPEPPMVSHRHTDQQEEANQLSLGERLMRVKTAVEERLQMTLR